MYSPLKPVKPQHAVHGPGGEESFTGRKEQWDRCGCLHNSCMTEQFESFRSS